MSRREIMEDNAKRVQRRKAEERFIRGLRGNYNLDHLTELQTEVQTEDRTVQLPKKPKKELVQGVYDTDVQEDFSVIEEFGSNIRCLEVTQGGATIWTAEHDGSVRIRSGAHGQVIHNLPRHTDAMVDTMFATDTHMWLGLSDGTVQVYDHLVFIHITEGKFHTASVTAFYPSFDGRMFSASDDGSLVKWDVESKNFEAMTKIIPGHSKGITALASYLYYLFTASADNSIKAINIENGSVQHALDGHTDEVLALAVVDEVLFSGGADSTVRIWSLSTMECIKVTDVASPVVSFAADPSSHRMLVGLQDGTLMLMRTLSEDNFAVEKTFAESSGKPLVTVKNVTAIDSLKIWTLASNGVNKVWYSSENQVAEAMKSTTAALKAVIQQDTIELDKWRTLVGHLQNVDRRRKFQLTHALESYHDDRLRRRYQWIWRKYLQMVLAQRRKLAISKRMAFEEHILFIRRFFSKWFRWYRATQNLRLKSRYSDLLMQTTQRGIVLFYFRKMQAFARHIKLSMKRRDFTALLGDKNVTFLQRIYFRRWLKFRNKRRVQNQRLLFAKAMLGGCDKTLMRLYYANWQNFTMKRTVRERKQKFGEMLMSVTIRGLRQAAYQRWAQYAREALARRRKERVGGTLLATTERGLMAAYWGTWMLYRVAAQKKQLLESRKQSETELGAMKEKYAALQRIVDEKKAVDELRRSLQNETDELNQRELKLTQLQQEKQQLTERIATKELEARERTVSIAEQMNNLMSALKAKVINFHLDFTLMHQIREKLKQNQPVTKIFLEAHQAVKRVIVEVTKKPHMTQEEWPLTQDQILKLPSHYLNVLLSSIKTMIATFDVMDKETRDSIQSDYEIVINAKWLQLIADVCVDHRRKTLRKR